MSCFCCIVRTFKMLSWKMNQKSCRNCLLFSKQNKAVFWDEVATNSRKRYFNIDENASTEQIYALLDDVESADEDYIDSLMNDSHTEFINEITQAAILQNISLATAEANLHIVPSYNQSKKKEKNKK